MKPPFLFMGLVAVFAHPASAAAPSQRTLNAAIPAAGLQSLSIDGANGGVTVIAADDDRVQVTVRLSPKAPSRKTVSGQLQNWFFASSYKSAADLIRASALSSRTVNSSLKLALSPPASSRRNRLREDWIVRAPARLFTSVSLVTGDVKVTGMNRGVAVDLGVGNATAAVASGPVSVRVKVGDADVSLASKFRSAELSSSVGHTTVWLDGARIPGRSFGSGEHQDLTGQGAASVKITVNVGEARLRAGRP